MSPAERIAEIEGVAPIGGEAALVVRFSCGEDGAQPVQNEHSSGLDGSLVRTEDAAGDLDCLQLREYGALGLPPELEAASGLNQRRISLIEVSRTPVQPVSLQT